MALGGLLVLTDFLVVCLHLLRVERFVLRPQLTGLGVEGRGRVRVTQ